MKTTNLTLHLKCIVITGILSFGLTFSVAAQFSGSGSGTLSDPFIITNTAELQLMSQTPSAHYILGNDIDASETENWNAGEGFFPVGTGRAPFTGSLNGNGFTISNLFINRPFTNVVGLFGAVDTDARIFNVALLDANITGQDEVGGLAGWNMGEISHSSVTGQITGNSITGGIAGACGIHHSVGYANITASYSSAAINSSSDSGGLAGRVILNCSIINSYSSGDVTGESKTGGLVGNNHGGELILFNSYTTGNVTGSSETMALIGGNNLGNTITGSYWNKETTGQTAGWPGDNDGSGGRTDIQMKQQATFTGWDFDSIWEIEEDVSYPSLQLLPQGSGIPDKLDLVAGNDLETAPGNAIPSPLKLRILDIHEKAVPNIKVQFTELTIPENASGGFFFTAEEEDISEIISSVSGIAEIFYTAGDKPGEYIIKASLSDFADVTPIEFVITVTGPQIPQNVKAESEAGRIILTWDPSMNTDYYLIYRAETSDNIEDALLLNSIDDTKYFDYDIIPDVEYSYWIAASDNFENRSELSLMVKESAGEVPEPESGTATLTANGGQWDYFDFSMGFASSEADTGSYLADIRGTSNEGVNFGNESAPQIVGKRIILLGTGTIDDVAYVPDWTGEDPWLNVSWEINAMPVSEGQLWGVYTREGNYAAMEITSVPEPYGNTFTFNYKYQPGGSPVFGGSGIVPVIPDSLVKISGDGQDGNTDESLAEPFVVRVIDEDGNGVDGIMVFFEITSVPDEASGASLSTVSMMTQSDGYSQTTLKLGDLEGTYIVTVSADELESTLEFTASAATATSINSSDTPTVFRLEQNYPNPFNPVTSIRYQVPTNSEIRLEVYDLLGRRVAILVNEVKQAGTHEISFDASNLSSGIYIYRLSALTGELFTKKMLLIK